MTPFHRALQLTRLSDGAFASNPTDDWRQGRTLFGGLSAALCYAACEESPAALPPLRSAQICYVGPAAGAVTIRPEILRQGKSMTFMASDLHAEAGLATRALFCFGSPRESAHFVPAPMAPDLPPPDACEPLFRDHRPTFTQHIDQRLAAGFRPVTAAPAGDMTVWVRHRDVAPPPSLASVIALGDALPPASMPRLSAPAAISTVTWSFDFVSDRDIDPAGWFLLQATDQSVGHGYSAQTMSMWDSDRLPILVARQNVALFA